MIKSIKLPELSREAAKRLDMPRERVMMICEGYWKFIEESMKALDFSVPLDKEPNRGKRTRFNVPFIGKIICKIDNGKQGKETEKGSRKACKEDAGICK